MEYLQAVALRSRISIIRRIGLELRLKLVGEPILVTTEIYFPTGIEPLFFPTQSTSKRAQPKDEHWDKIYKDQECEMLNGQPT